MHECQLSAHCQDSAITLCVARINQLSWQSWSRKNPLMHWAPGLGITLQGLNCWKGLENYILSDARKQRQTLCRSWLYKRLCMKCSERRRPHRLLTEGSRLQVCDSLCKEAHRRQGKDPHQGSQNPEAGDPRHTAEEAPAHCWEEGPHF